MSKKAHDEFLHGVLAAMDLVLCHGHTVCAGEIIVNVGPEDLWAHAKKDSYVYLKELSEVYKSEHLRKTRRRK